MALPSICRFCEPGYAPHGVMKDLLKCGKLRGGGGRGNKAPASLLEGLSQLLQAVPEPEDHEKELFEDLKDLVRNKPRNLLQALKSLVVQHTKAQGASRNVVVQQPARRVTLEQPEQQSEWKTVQRKKVRAVSGYDSWNYRRDDWRAPSGMALGFANDATHLGTSLDESSGVAWIMATDNSEEAEEAVRMVQGANYDKECHGLTLIFDGRSHEIGDWGQDAELVRVPGTCGGRLQLKRVWIVRIGSQTADLNTRCVTPLKVTKPPATLAEQRSHTFVLRVTLDKNYSPENWALVSKKPAQYFRAWASSQGPKSFAVLDTWNFRPVTDSNTRITGFARVDSTTTARTLFHASGSFGGCARYFVDIVGEKDKVSPANKVAWIPWNDSETYSSYLKRVHDDASHGLALGDKQLGIKVSASDVRWSPPLCLWRMIGTPAHWHLTDIEALAFELGFENVSVESKLRLRGGSAWMFRAKRKDDRNIIQQTVDWGDGKVSEVEVTKEANRRTKGPSCPVISERVIDFSLKDLVVKPRIAKGTPRFVQAASFEARGKGVSGARKRVHDGVEQNSEDDEMLPSEGKKVAWLPDGRVIENVGEGNCLWHALAEAASTPAKRRSHRQMRAWTVSTMKDNVELMNMWVADGRYNDKGQPSNMSWEEYLKDQETPGKWSGALEAAACAIAMGWRLWIATDTNELHCLNHEAKNGFVALKCKVAEGHYELVVDVNEEQLWERRRQLNEQGKAATTRLLRAGVVHKALTDFASSASQSADHRPGIGKLSDFASPRASVPKGNAASHQRSLHGVAPSAAKWKLSHFATPKASHSRKGGNGRGSVYSDIRTHGTGASSSSKVDKSFEPVRRKGRPPGESVFADSSGGFSWSCSQCPYKISSDSADTVSRRKAYHITSCHDGIGPKFHKSSFSKLSVVSLKEDFAWKCPLCKLGITQQDKDGLSPQAFFCLKQKHCQEKHPKTSHERWVKLNAHRKKYKSAEFKQKCRVSQINAGLSKRMSVPPGFEHFTLPNVARFKGKKRFHLSSALRCKKCLCCFRYPKQAAEHKCRPTNKRGRAVNRSLNALNKARKLWFGSPQGFDSKSLVQLFDIAEKAITGAAFATNDE